MFLWSFLSDRTVFLGSGQRLTCIRVNPAGCYQVPCSHSDIPELSIFPHPFKKTNQGLASWKCLSSSDLWCALRDLPVPLGLLKHSCKATGRGTQKNLLFWVPPISPLLGLLLLCNHLCLWAIRSGKLGNNTDSFPNSNSGIPKEQLHNTNIVFLGLWIQTISFLAFFGSPTLTDQTFSHIHEGGSCYFDPICSKILP